MNNFVYSLAVYSHVDILSMGDLVRMGLSLAYADCAASTEPSAETHQFIHKAAKDCVILLKACLGKDGENMISRIELPGRSIAAAMDFVLLRGTPTFGIHELFFNGLVAILHGALGTHLKDLPGKGDALWKYRYENRGLDAGYSCEPYELALNFDRDDTCTFVKYLNEFGRPHIADVAEPNEEKKGTKRGADHHKTTQAKRKSSSLSKKRRLSTENPTSDDSDHSD